MHFKQKARIGSLAIIISIAMLYGPFIQMAAAQATGSVVGMVVSGDFSSPIKGAKVKLYNPKTEMFFSSNTTKENGLYAIKDVPIGEYHVVVVTQEGESPCDLMVKVRKEPATPLTLALQQGKASVAAQLAKEEKWYKKRWGSAKILGDEAGIMLGIYKIPKGSKKP
jgi:hypothetical protein